MRSQGSKAQGTAAELLGFFRERRHRANQFDKAAPPLKSIRGVVSVLESVPIAIRCSRRSPAMHSAAAVPHRRRPALAIAPCPRSTSGAQVHG